MENQSTSIETLVERIKSYVENRIDLLRLKAIDKSSGFLSGFISKIIITLVLFLFVIFLNIALALVIGEMLGKSYYGFFIMAAFNAITGFVVYRFRHKWIKTPITNVLIKNMLDQA